MKPLYYLLKFVFPSLIWRLPSREKIIYLTFDDGPVPEVTSWVLDLLGTYNVKATFFCIGNNVFKHSDIYDRIIREGHATGNHTYSHLNAFNTPGDLYIDDIKKAEQEIDSVLFRPPYGKLSPALIKRIASSYKIIMWDVLSYDYDEAFTPENCFETVKANTTSGSIIVFHDSVKAFPRMKTALQKTLQHYTELGYRFEVISSASL